MNPLILTIIILVIVVVAVVLGLVFWFISGYNKLVKLSSRVDNSWAQIDVQLKQRFDLIHLDMTTCADTALTVSTANSQWDMTTNMYIPILDII